MKDQHVPEPPDHERIDWRNLLFSDPRSVASPRARLAPSGEYGAARLASRADIEGLLETAGRRPEDYLPLLPAYIITHDQAPDVTACDGLPVCLGQTSPNVLLLGASGSCKSQKGTLVAAWRALEQGYNLIFIGVKGRRQTRLIRRLARKLGREGDLTLLAPAAPGRTAGWTGLKGCAEASAATLVAEALAGVAAGDSRWHDGAWAYNQAVEAIQQMIMAICTDNPPESRTLLQLRDVISAGQYSAFADAHSDFPALRRFASYVADNRNGETVAATMGEMTRFIEGVRPFLSADETDLEAFIEHGGALIYELDEQDVDRLRPLTAILLGELFAALQRRASLAPDGRVPRKTIIVIDELAACGPVPGLPRLLHTNRERGYYLVAGLQSASQLPGIYGGQADAVLAGWQTIIGMPGGMDGVSAEYLSQRTGMATVRLPHVTRQYQGSDTGTEVTSCMWSLGPRRLLLPGEIARPQLHPVLGAPVTVLPGDGTPPYQAYLTAAYEVGWLARIMEEIDEMTQDDDSRPEPLGAVPAATEPVSRFTNVAGWTAERIRERIEEVKLRIGWEEAGGDVRAWWASIESDWKDSPSMLLRLAEELAFRQTTMTKLFEAFSRSETTNAQANLHMLDYLLMLDRDRRRRRPGS